MDGGFIQWWLCGDSICYRFAESHFQYDTLFLTKWKILIPDAARTNIPGVKNGENTSKVGTGDGALVV